MRDLVSLLDQVNNDYRMGRKRCEDDEGSNHTHDGTADKHGEVTEGAFLAYGQSLSTAAKWPGRAPGTSPK